jgi:hypothetical protein
LLAQCQSVADNIAEEDASAGQKGS